MILAAFHGGKDRCVFDVIRIAVILLASLAAGSCSESSNGDTGCGSDCRLETIGPGGGTLASVDQLLSVEIPAGALSEDVEVTIKPADDAPAGAIGTVYELGPAGTQFAEPVAIRIDYADENLGDVEPWTLSLSIYESGEWIPLSAMDLDLESSSISGQTLHFSYVGLTPPETVGNILICGTVCEEGYYPFSRTCASQCGSDTGNANYTNCQRIHLSHAIIFTCGICPTLYSTAERTEGLARCGTDESSGCNGYNGSTCIRTCGDQTIDADEECDGSQLGDASCESLGFEGGLLGCTSLCTLDTSDCSCPAGFSCTVDSDCTPEATAGMCGTNNCTCVLQNQECGSICVQISNECGNGIIDAGEDCDGNDLGGETCRTLESLAGYLRCSAACSYDTTYCTGYQCLSDSDCMADHLCTMEGRCVAPCPAPDLACPMPDRCITCEGANCNDPWPCEGTECVCQVVFEPDPCFGWITGTSGGTCSTCGDGTCDYQEECSFCPADCCP
jgi:hypothetical protein